MTAHKRRGRARPEGSVFPRGKKWAYAYFAPPDALTGDRQRVVRSGFATDEDAWDALEQVQQNPTVTTTVDTVGRTVTQFFEEWFSYVRTTTAVTTAANYERLARAYVLPWIGQRRLTDIQAPVVAALYDQLLRGGRRKSDTNWPMYQAWQSACAAGREISARELADAVGISRPGATRALKRYQAGRIPTPPKTGLAPKTVKTVAIMLGAAMTTAFTWRYIALDPTAGVKAPSVVKRAHRTWSPDQMTRFLAVARSDRLYALWVLAATTGMRRSELCGIARSSDVLDLDAATLRMTSTRVIADGAVHDGDGKSPGSRRPISLDRFTIAVLREHLKQLDRERIAQGENYHDHGLLFCWEDGTPIYPDTITERFNHLVDAASVPRITLHDVRHSYATIALRSGVHPKIVSTRLGHSRVAFTLDTYSADIPELDQEAAEAISQLFVPGGVNDDSTPVEVNGETSSASYA